MAQIPDFTSEAFDDPKELRKEITRVLNEIKRDLSAPLDVNLGDNVILGWIDDGRTVLPDGYEIADGTKGTFDAKNSKIIFIQKVK